MSNIILLVPYYGSNCDGGSRTQYGNGSIMGRGYFDVITNYMN